MSKLLYLVLFLGLILACAFGIFQFQKSQRRLPIGYEEFPKWLPAALKKQAIWLAIAVAAEIFGGFAFGFIVMLFAVTPWLFFKPGVPKAPKTADLEAEAKNRNAQWLASLGPNAVERSKAIEAMFEQRTKTILASHYERWSDRVLDPNLPDEIHYIAFTVARNLAMVPPHEREALRIAEHLNSLAADSPNPNPLYARWRAALVWADGKGQQQGDSNFLNLKPESPIADYMSRMHLGLAQVLNAITIHASQVAEDPRQPQELRELCRGLLERFAGAA